MAYEGVPREGAPPPSPHPHLGLLQAVVDEPEVLAEELLADGLPIDADALSDLHQVRGAERGGGAQSTTAPPAPPKPLLTPPYPPVKAGLQPVAAEDALGEGTH